jgi:hypothetical protein
MHDDHEWEPTPPGSVLVAWDAFRDSCRVSQARLYRTGDRCFVVLEKERDTDGMGDHRGRARCHWLDGDAARALYARLRIHMVPEETAFDS